MRIGHNDRRRRRWNSRPRRPGGRLSIRHQRLSSTGDMVPRDCVESYQYRAARSARSAVSYSRSDNLNWRRSAVLGARSDRSAFLSGRETHAFSEDVFVGSFEPDPHAVLEAALGPLELFEVRPNQSRRPRRPSDGDAASGRRGLEGRPWELSAASPSVGGGLGTYPPQAKGRKSMVRAGTRA